MGISRQYAQGIINIYIEAWEKRDPDLICMIFTEHATYHERVLGDPIAGWDGIRAYWQSKVVEGQANIRCRPLSLYVDGDTVIVEWQAKFDDLAQGVRKHMREIAVLEFERIGIEGYRICSLREYWSSQTIGTLHSTSIAPGSALI